MTSYIHKEVHDKGSHIEWVEYIYFYDIHIRLWTITQYGNGNQQKGESQYFNNRDEVKYWYPEFKFVKEGGR